MKLTYYLFRPSVKKFDQAVKESKLEGESPFERVALKNVDFEGQAYLQRDNASAPSWLPYVQPYCQIDDPEKLLNRTNSFLLLLKVEGRIFAVTTGFGFTAINREELELDFGLKVTLNAVEKNSLRAVQSRNVDANAVHKHIVTTRDSGVAVFDVDFYQELLARMEGKPKKPKGNAKPLGARVEGADSCILTSDAAFPELGNKCKQLLTVYSKSTWKQDFPFFGIVRPVRRESLVDELNGELRAAIDARDQSLLSLALPDISTRGAITQFSLHHPNCRTSYIDDLNLDDVFAYLDAQGCTNVDVARFGIVGIDGQGGGNPMTGNLPLFRCAVFQTERGGKTYVLTLGKWYEVDKDYVKRVNKRLADRKPSLLISKQGYLPTIGKNENEGAYNIRAAKANGWVCMDKKNCPIPDGHSRVEVCDLFGDSNEFVHVKLKTESATLSHLFSQGAVSARLFRDYSEYREFLDGQLNGAGKKSDTTNVKFGDFRVVYAITAPPKKTLPDELPFFSKVNLLHHLSTIERMGFNTGLYHVHVV